MRVGNDSGLMARVSRGESLTLRARLGKRVSVTLKSREPLTYSHDDAVFGFLKQTLRKLLQNSVQRYLKRYI